MKGDVFPGSARLVEGVLPPSSLLLIGPSGVGKTIFCKHFLYNGLLNGEGCLYVSTGESPDEIERSMKNFGFEVSSYKERDLFRIVDCHSWKTGGTSPSKWVVTNPGDLAIVSMNIENAMRGLNKIRLVLDSITGLTSTCSFNPTYLTKFLQIIVAKLRLLNGNAIFVVAPEAHDQQFLSYLHEIFDGALEMKEEETGNEIKRLLRVFSIKGANHKTKWMPFDISNKGIVVRSDVETRCVMCSRLIEQEPYVETVGGKQYSFDSQECASTYRKLKAIYGDSFE